MKKVLLGLFAISALAFGASNQQMVDSTLSAKNPGDEVGAGVPFEVRVNVVKKGPELVLTDENNNIYDVMVFDHGTKMAGTLSRSVVENHVILQRTDGHAFSADEAGDIGTTTYTGVFEVEQNNSYDPTTHILTLDKLGTNGEADENSTMPTEFNFITKENGIKATDNKMRTLVQSVIKAGTQADSGMYIGTGTFTAKLTVKTK